ncbi:NAD(P)/FAD-dependent oxidoreductase [Rhizobium sp. BR 362]|uniref:NAD(P)/FAD-dependent oxidoreductase n=1 Tax=Rhizobium sp. BR 362 TaxID=3040670 RepID=UPI002F3FEA1B
MSKRESTDIAIIGAGVIGLAVALRLASEGREVTLLDPNTPGSGASYGNAGTFADYACVPVGNPDVLKSLPHLLFGKDSPFSLRWAALFQLAPWISKFAYQSLPAPARANAIALARLLKDALPAWEEMAVDAGAQSLLRKNGCLYLQPQANAGSKPSWAHAIRTELGVHQEILSSQQVAAMEPTLPSFEGKGIFFPDSMNVTDPAELMHRLLSAGETKGVRVCRARVEHLSSAGNRTRLSGSDVDLDVGTVIIAAGAFSKGLALQAGDNIPLETERGYHLEYKTETPLLQRSVCPTHLGFYMTPLAGRLRVAGTVELGGTDAAANMRRFDFLDRGVRQYFPDIGQPHTKWLGFRPSLPNSLPVIGRSRSSAKILYAFGHGHLGLTLAAVTSRLIANLVKEI